MIIHYSSIFGMKFWIPVTCLSISCQILGLSFCQSPMTLAQIVPDSTLNNPTVVIPDANIRRIEAGTRRGNNLFHSFEQFSLPTGTEAFFNNTLEIQNIFSRVTGLSISNIDGIIRANGNANLFLINPNGIIFGPNARLEIGGSFLSSTANTIEFADGSQFSASNPNSPLLTVNVPIGLQMGQQPRAIVNQSLAVNNNNTIVGLEVQQNQTLGLVGGNILLNGGYLTATQGRIELASGGTQSFIPLTFTPTGYELGTVNGETLGNIRLSQAAFVNASGNRGGDIQVQGGRLSVVEGSEMRTNTTGSEPGGTLTVTTSEFVEVRGNSAEGQFLSSLQVAVEPEATGNGGNLTIQTPRLIVSNGGQILTTTFGEGNGGNLTVLTKTIEINGVSSTGQTSSGLFATVSENATGNGGNLTLQTQQLRTLGGGQIAVTTFGAGNSGNLTVQATEIELTGSSPRLNLPPIVSGLFAGTDLDSSGNGGNLTIETERLIIREGAEAQASTLSRGDAGNLTVRASSVELTGRTPDGQFPSALLAVSGLVGVSTEATGSGGNLSLETGELMINDGAEITVSADGSGDAGNLTVVADQVRLDRQAQIRAETATGSGGNIILRSPDIRLRGNSGISSTAGTQQGPGEGGNITIDTETLIGLENSDLTANAFQGQGGQVVITASGVFGLQRREQLTFASDITAFSQVNPQLSGEVKIVTPDVDPSQGLLATPTNVIDIESLIAQTCSPDNRLTQSRFVIVGRGGIPASPTTPLDSNQPLVDLGNSPKSSVFTPSLRSEKIPLESQKQRDSLPLVEAQGWTINLEGKVVLTATIPTPTHSIPQLYSIPCPPYK